MDLENWLERSHSASLQNAGNYPLAFPEAIGRLHEAASSWAISRVNGGELSNGPSGSRTGIDVFVARAWSL